MFWFWKSHTSLSFGIGVYLSSIILFSNLFTPVAGMIGDRLTYVSSFGFILAFGYLLWLLFQRLPQGGKLIFTILIASGIIAFSVLTVVRNTHWKDRLTLMKFDISYLNNSAQAHNQLARAYMDASYSLEGENNALEMRNNAVIQFKKALEIYPNFFNVWYDLGRTYMILNRPDAAISCYKQMTQIDSTYIDAYLLTASNAEQVGDFSLAEEYYKKTIRNFPNMVDGYTGFTGFLIKTGKLNESKEIALQGLEHHLDNQTLIQMLLRVSELEQDTASGIKY
jgi:tetratricopeptide (TPR) repeat protein